jgi:hypothetical protein
MAAFIQLFYTAFVESGLCPYVSFGGFYPAVITAWQMVLRQLKLQRLVGFYGGPRVTKRQRTHVLEAEEGSVLSP